MAYWWEDVPLAENKPEGNADAWWSAAPEVKQEKPRKGSVLPVSTDERGNVRFDSDAGILGPIKRALMLPKQVMSGEVNPSSDEGIARTLEMATVVGPVSPSVNSWTYGLGGAKVKPATPTAEKLKEVGSQGFKDARALNVDYSSEALRNVALGVRRSLDEDGVIDDLAPKAYAVLKRLESPPKGSIAPYKGVYAARRAFERVAKSPDDTERLAAVRGIEAIDEFLGAGRAEDVISGPAALVGEITKDARGNYAAAMRSNRISGIEEGAALKASAANSGRNLDNTIRQRVVSNVLDPQYPSRARGYSAEELAALDKTARGDIVRNTARNLGNLGGGGGGLGMAFTGAAAGGMAAGTYGSLAGAAAGLGVPAAGWGFKSLGNRMTSNALNAADDLIRQRSPLFQQMQEAAPLQTINPMARTAPARALAAPALEGGNASSLSGGNDMGAVNRAALRVSSPLYGSLGKGGAAQFAQDLSRAAMAGGASSRDVADRLRKAGVPQETIARVIETGMKSGLLVSIDE